MRLAIDKETLEIIVTVGLFLLNAIIISVFTSVYVVYSLAIDVSGLLRCRKFTVMRLMTDEAVVAQELARPATGRGGGADVDAQNGAVPALCWRHPVTGAAQVHPPKQVYSRDGVAEGVWVWTDADGTKSLSEASPQLVSALGKGEKPTSGDFVCNIDTKTLLMSPLAQVPPDVMGTRDNRSDGGAAGVALEAAVDDNGVQMRELVQHENPQYAGERFQVDQALADVVHGSNPLHAPAALEETRAGQTIASRRTHEENKRVKRASRRAARDAGGRGDVAGGEKAAANDKLRSELRASRRAARRATRDAVGGGDVAGGRGGGDEDAADATCPSVAHVIGGGAAHMINDANEEQAPAIDRLLQVDQIEADEDAKDGVRKEKKKWTAAEKRALRSSRRAKRQSKRLARIDDSNQGVKAIDAAAADGHIANPMQQPEALDVAAAARRGVPPRRAAAKGVVEPIREDAVDDDEGNDAPRAAAQPRGLPRGWSEHVHADGRTYYCNEFTKKTKRKKPTLPAPPVGWKVHPNADRGQYYHNASTGATQWKHPHGELP